MWRTNSSLGVRVLACLSLASCASDLSERLEGQSEALGTALLVESVPDGESTRTRINASDSEVWVHYRFADDRAFAGAELGDVGEEMWDLAFQRFRIRTNGGVSGAGDVEVAVLPDVEFSSVRDAPAEGYRQDAPDADGDGEAEAVFETAEDGWYVYDFATHTLSPSPLAYVVKTHDEQFYALRFESYYDDAGSSGHPSFLHRSVNGPEVFR